MGLLEKCEELFQTTSLYDLLGVDRTATDAEVRRSYYKVSLRVHPDRAPDDPLATEKFQVLGKLYAVLCDAEQRAVYDETGVVDEESDTLKKERCWEDYWRVLFPTITLKDILDFEKKYQGSAEEREDLLKLYVKHEGDMDLITSSAMCCTVEDEPRLCAILREAIEAEEVPAFPAFTKESAKKTKARRKRADKERVEAEEMQKELGLGDEEDSLAMMIKVRNNQGVCASLKSLKFMFLNLKP
ncbi:dnaJ homolog subfamily C member 9 isoform X2 [Gadus macrocephalus]|uniref:dnaJ homolog subfamily C member 9 isoform X2 n=1 Tax=Gadus macrocephalus TaxID=80720 RepID=UPI0028CB4A8A|nr:dnaJ homolog subfamily C member 9 isoform X2 [Gadus macrocephalus]